MNTTHRRLTITALLLASLSPLPLSPLCAAAEETISVGGLLCLTGDCAEVGENSRRGLELAAEELNAAGGVLGKKIMLKFEDTREMDGPGSAISAYQHLVLDPAVRFLVGPTWTVGGLPLAPILAKRPDILAISPSLGVAAYNEAADTIFNTWPHDDFATETLAEYALKQGWKTAAVLSNESPWESAQAKHFIETYKKLGGEITAFLEPSPQVKDLRTEISKIKRSQPRVIFMSNYTTMDIAAKELRNQQVNDPMMGILLDDIRLKNAGGAFEGLLYVQYPSAQPDFVERFKAKFKESSGMSADTAYDALKMLSAAIQAAGSVKVEAVKQKLQALQYKGASGEIHFDKDGGVRKLPDIYAVMNGTRVRVGSAEELLGEK